MIPVIPWYITLAVVAGGATVAVLVAFLFPRGPVRLGVGAFLGVWYALAIIAAPSLASLAGADPYALSLVLPIFGVAGPLLALTGYWSFPSIRRGVDGLSIPLVISLQAYRTLGATFLILMAQGQLPAHFALPAGWGDVAIGMAAPIVGLLLARGVRWPALIWSAVGLTDLFVAVGMGTGYATPYLVPGVTSRLPAAAAMGAYPMILVPIFAVPVAILLHVVALRGILKGTAPAPVEALA